MSLCYLIHFDRPFQHARHYLGTTTLTIEERVARHRKGNGAKLLRAVTEAGIGWSVVRTWEGGRDKETELKRRKNGAKLCPLCSVQKHLMKELHAGVGPHCPILFALHYGSGLHAISEMTRGITK